MTANVDFALLKEVLADVGELRLFCFVSASCSRVMTSHASWNALARHVPQRGRHPTPGRAAHQGCPHRGEEDGDRGERQSAGGPARYGWPVRRTRYHYDTKRRGRLAVFAHTIANIDTIVVTYAQDNVYCIPSKKSTPEIWIAGVGQIRLFRFDARS